MSIAKEVLKFTGNDLEKRADAFRTINELWYHGSNRYLPGKEIARHPIYINHSLRFKDNSLIVAAVDAYGNIKHVYAES